MAAKDTTGPRTIALVGPYGSGKTMLLESILHETKATDRKGSVDAKNSVGDWAAEARAHGMSVEVNVARTRFLGEEFIFLDCPGSVEFSQEWRNVLPGVDAAVLVCEPGRDKVMAMLPQLKVIDAFGVPCFIFVNKIDKATGSVVDLFEALQKASHRPLVMREFPVLEGEHVTGYVDLASERCYFYREGEPSRVVEMPPGLAEEEQAARYAMLETLADFDDHLMEELLDEVEPSRAEVYEQLAQDLAEGKILPVFVGSAAHDNGITRLLKALRHEVPAVAGTAARLGLEGVGGCNLLALKTFLNAQGKTTLARILTGAVKDGDLAGDERIGGLFHLQGGQSEKIAAAVAGDVVALGRLEKVHTGDMLCLEGAAAALPVAPEGLVPVYALAIRTEARGDEVKLSGALAKLIEEDPSLAIEQRPDTHEILLWGQGEIHLQVALERLERKYGIKVATEKPKVPYREAIRKPTTQHSRFKRQSGGHGQFGDVHLEIKPLPRGAGFSFDDRVVGGAVPRQYIPAVEQGVREYLEHGPLGFPVVDISVTLFDGQYHAVDSSELAFKTAGRLAMSEGLPNCAPVLLEPVYKVDVAAPTEDMSKVTGIITSRRGQILGFDAREGWAGWDVITAMIPQAELHDLILELRSATHGVGSYVMEYDHLQELTGRMADQVVASHQAD